MFPLKPCHGRGCATDTTISAATTTSAAPDPGGAVDLADSLTAAQKTGDRPVEARGLRSLARPLKALSRPEEAPRDATAALAVFEALGSPEVAVTRERLAELGE